MSIEQAIPLNTDEARIMDHTVGSETQQAEIKRPFVSSLIEGFWETREWLKNKQFELTFAEAKDCERRIMGGKPWPGFLTVCWILENIPF